MRSAFDRTEKTINRMATFYGCFAVFVYSALLTGGGFLLWMLYRYLTTKGLI